MSYELEFDEFYPFPAVILPTRLALLNIVPYKRLTPDIRLQLQYVDAAHPDHDQSAHRWIRPANPDIHEPEPHTFSIPHPLLIALKYVDEYMHSSQ
ncbi:hypothetical protein D3C78_1340440 [compost metagenome]